ncbi:MAG: NAD(P)H-quinone oxidoreductase [Proteobacteria bacterium]|nr:NAD(P)H-quinone oxidoreductase [Pseudomonadota bacterium]
MSVDPMRLVTILKSSDKMELVTGPLPEPKKDEVLIKVFAAGINRPDILQRQGLYPPPPNASPVLGLEVAGEIVARGSQVANFEVGNRVCALTNGGGYAQYCTAPAAQCLPWPHNYDAIHAAALPENYFTIWANVFMQGRLQKKESLLVHGGSSGIGVTAIQLAHEFANPVYATAGTTEKCQACIGLGAQYCVNYHEEDFETKILAYTQNQGVDMVLDMVGAPYFHKNLNILKKDGRLIEIATQHGAIVNQLDLGVLMQKRLIVTGSTMRPRTSQEKAIIAQSLLDNVWPILSQGRCQPLIYKTFHFDQVNEAHQLMESSRHIGKIILTLSPV